MWAGELEKRRSDLSVRHRSGQATLVSAPGDARRRSPSPDPGAPRANRRTPSARRAKAVRVVTRAESLDGITGHHGSLRNLRQQSAVRPPEPKRPVGPARDLIALLVHRPVMPPTEQRKVRERRQASVGPVAEMMPLAEADAAAREAAAPVAIVERSPQGGGNGPGPRP